MQKDVKISKETILKKYAAHSIEYIDSLFPNSDIQGLILDYSELFCTDSHEPESFKKNLSSDLDHALMPNVPHQPSPKFKPKFYDEKKTLYSPFEATGLTKNRLEAKVWFYLDEEFQIQGPFSTIQMDSWFNHGELHGSTKVAYNQKEKFCKIYKFVDIFKDFELEEEPPTKGKGKTTQDPKNVTQEAPSGFKRFGFVNYNKGKSEGNSPLIGKNDLAKEDPIDENHEADQKPQKKSAEKEKTNKSQFSKAPGGGKKGANYDHYEQKGGNHEYYEQKGGNHEYYEPEHNNHGYKKKTHGKGKKDYVEYVPKN